MRLSIIPSDGSVCKDNVCYTNLVWSGTPVDVHALQWFDTNTGWIEFVGNVVPNEQITVLPDWANAAISAWDVANQPPPPYVPTAEDNQQTASSLLYKTDWTTIPDVSDPTKSNPYLVNVQDFLDFRNQVRQIALNPPAGNIVFPTVPTAVWSS